MNEQAAQADSTKSGRWAPTLLVVVGCVSAAVYLALALLSRQFTYGGVLTERPGPTMLALLALGFALYLIAIRAAVRCPQGRRLLATIVIGSVLFRLILVFSWPIQEIDIYRYLWDGQVACHGVNPFRYSPKQVRDARADDVLPRDLRRLVELRDSSPEVATVLYRVHYEELPTIYPPVSQAVFAVCSTLTPPRATIFWRLVIMRACFVAFDLGTLVLVMGLLRLTGRHQGWSAAYGWCPLLIKEIANSGHLDAIAVFLTTAAVLIAARALFRKASSAGGVPAAFLLALAVGAKLYPVILVPLFGLSWMRRFGWRRTLAPAIVFAAVVVIVLWPMLPKDQTGAAHDTSSSVQPQDPSRSLKIYLGRWEMNDFLFMLLLENVKPDGNRTSDQLTWFAIIPDGWRSVIVEPPAAWLEIEPSAAAFLLTRIATSGVFILAACLLAWRVGGSREPLDWLEAAFLTVAWFWLLSPTQFPWYWAWAMPLVVFARGRVWLAVSGLALIYYLRFWLGAHWPDEPLPVIGYSGRPTFDYVVTWLEFAPWFTLLACCWAYRHFGNRSTNSSRDRLIVFSRYPRPGKTKTRLIPALGPQGAADLQRQMTRHTLRWAEDLAGDGAVSVEVHFEGGSEDLMSQSFGHGLPYQPQPTGDLGERLARAFSAAFESGARRAVIVGTDCPGLSRTLAQNALTRLAEDDLVLGPAADGGYYLIGMRREIPELFSDVPWGTGQVLETTLRKAGELDLSFTLLQTLADVDRPEDLDVWHQAVADSPASDSPTSRSPVADSLEGGEIEKISVIVPTLDEEHDLFDRALGSIAAGHNVETIVVAADGGGERDSTRQIAQAHAARLLLAPKGRARQMNAGAAVATGQILLFLHADTRLPEDFDHHVRHTLRQPEVAAGAFRLAIEGAFGSLGWIARAANLRARFLQMPYGDQALFLRTDTFRRLGGFADVPILEDIDLIRRLRRTGRVRIAPAKVVTSARRWLELGTWRATWINQQIIIGHRLGISHQQLARWYRAGRDGR